MMNGPGMAGMGWMWLFGLLVLVGVVVLAVALVKALSGKPQNTAAPHSSRGAGMGSGRGREILQERYARGELSTEEYQERLRTLEEDGR